MARAQAVRICVQEATAELERVMQELQEELERKMKPKYLARSRRFRENSVRKAEKRQGNREKGQKES